MNFTITSLAAIGFDTIYNAFSEAFKDYEMQVNREELSTMINRRGFNADLSFAAFLEQEIVAFTLNGTGNYQGLLTAYDTGTGTVEAYRGNKLAGKIFDHSIPFLKKAGIKQYLLEVLQHNTTAVNIYKNSGFEVTREFNYFVGSLDALKFKNDPSAVEAVIKDIDLQLCKKKCVWHEFAPSWQNSFDAIERKPEDFQIRGAFIDDTFIGYCISEPASGDITQIAVTPDLRRKGIGSLLFLDAIKLFSSESFKVVNTDLKDQGFTAFMKSFGIVPSGKQYEMIRKL